MIVDIVQTKTNFNMEWRANTKGKEIAVGVAPFIKGKFQVQINENSNDQTEDETTDQNDSNDTIIKGDSIILNQMYTDITVGKNHYIQLIQIPKDYKVEDIVCASSNDAIATGNKEGIVTAVSEGSAVITVSTKDKKYNACLAVTVIDLNKKEFEPLKDFKTVNYYFGNSEGVLI